MSTLSNFIPTLPFGLFASHTDGQYEVIEKLTPEAQNSTMPEQDQPITGICLISKANNVPTGYQCIRKAFDEASRDADLMADSILERKDRFLCITRAYTLAGSQTPVLEDIKLINERDPVPSSYIPLLQTVDTKEKGTTRRIICVKISQRQAGMVCIFDIIFIYRTKRAPEHYTLIGEINGLQMCVKQGTVPPLRTVTSSELPHAHLNTTRSDDKDFLDGIPFQINPKYLKTNGDLNKKGSTNSLQSLSTLSNYDIEKLFYYDFNLERSALSD